MFDKYINNFKQITNKFEEIDNLLEKSINIYLIGGSVLLYNNLKEGTKDIDLVVRSLDDKENLEKALNILNFKKEVPSKEYSNFDLDHIFISEKYRLDIFNRVVCGKLVLSENMVKRAKLIKKYKFINLYTCSLEDVLVFKSITERDGDIDDCKSICFNSFIDWKVILEEIKFQIKEYGSSVWITWFEERLNLLEDNGVDVLIISEIRKLSEKYFKSLEK